MTTTDGQKKWLASNCELVSSLDSPSGIYQLFREIRLNPLTQTHRHFFRNNSGDIVGIFRTEAEATQWAFDELE